LIERLLDPRIQQFIRDHENDSPSKLMLRANQFPEWDMSAIVDQVVSRKKAKNKLSDWYSKEGIIWPKPLSIEQSSSQITAEYKAHLVSGKSMIDLTGGFGVDTYYFSKRFDKVTHVEINEVLHQIVKQNFILLDSSIRSICSTAEEYLKDSEPVDFIYLDPARRDEENAKVVFLEYYSPNVVDLQNSLLSVAKQVMIKVSPLLDIKKVLHDIDNVSEVHVVSVKNEVKELLLILKPQITEEPILKTINLGGQEVHLFDFTFSEEVSLEIDASEVSNFLYEPNASILKAGGFKSIGYYYGLKKLEANSHLYTSEGFISNFPGRSFKVLKELSLSKKKLKKDLHEFKANIAVRNYPATVDEIRRKTGIQEGGDQYIFATMDKKGKKVLLCEKI